MDKRYQVFVSSTYADLKEERQKIIQALMEMDCIPAGMELFPAVDEEQFAFIKKIIDDCDYYLLVIGGRYGTLTPQGISYTEQEYDYAISKNLKVIALLHENPDDIPLGRSEKDPELRARLIEFREKVSTGRLVRFWGNARELPGIVALSLSRTIKTYPARGWIRADRVASEDLLTEINDIRKQNLELNQQISKLSSTPSYEVADLAGLGESIELSGDYWYRGDSGHAWSVRLTWSQIFSYIAPYLIQQPTASTVKDILGKAAFEKASTIGYSPQMDDQLFQTVSVQLRALGLVEIQYIKNIQGRTGLYWSATPPGERLMLELRTIKTST